MGGVVGEGSGIQIEELTWSLFGEATQALAAETVAMDTSTRWDWGVMRKARRARVSSGVPYVDKRGLRVNCWSISRRDRSCRGIPEPRLYP